MATLPSSFRPHRLSVFRPSENFAADGRPLADSWSTVTTDVPCRFETGKSQQAPNGFVLEETDNLFTLDLIHMAQGVDVRVNDVVKQTTGPDAGQYWRVRGNPQQRSMLIEKQSVLANRITQPSGCP